MGRRGKCGTPQWSGVGERREDGVNTRRSHGEKSRNDEAKVNIQRRSRKEDCWRKRAITLKDSQKPAYNVFSIFALSRRIVETAFLEWTIRHTTESVSLAKLALFDRFAPVSSLAQVSRVNDSHACMHFYRGSARLWHRHLHFTAPSILSFC